MVSNKFTVLAAAAALSQVVLGSPHQILHGRQGEKRDVVVHTVVQTVYVNAAAPTVVVSPPVVENNAVVEEKPKTEKPKASVKTKTKTESTSSGSTIKNKKGVVYNSPECATTFLGACAECSWVWNWDSAYTGDIKGATFIPTMWGEKEDHIAKWPANWKASYDAGGRTFFSFNEPDLLPSVIAEHPDSGIRMEPGYAVTAQAKYFKDLPSDAYIGAPSITNGGSSTEAPTGLDWLKSFVSGCNANSDCRFDFCNIHWYSEMASTQSLYDRISEASDACNEGNTGEKKKIWLTEFQPNDGDAQQRAAWINEVIPKLDAIEELEGYSYFKSDVGFLMTSVDALGADGTAYATA